MNDLDQLKQLLFGAEKQALDQISDRVERREVRTADVAEVLSEAIDRSYREDSELVESLTQPVGECLQKALHDDPETYSDALYPIMGPAIRKSITHALRNFSQQMNEAIEHSFSPKGFKWRLEASRAGVPFGEYVLQKTMLYRIEQAYLISRENGLLVEHVHHEASRIKDSDAVSAMFTAIQDFVKESFSPDRTGRLESADMGEFTLWAVHGPHALLVCVIRGVPPKNLRTDLSAILERIHFRYGDAIREYKGDTSSVPDVKEELERCLRFEAREVREASDEKEETRSGPSVWIIVGLLLLAGLLVFLGVRSWTYSQQLAKFDDALRAAPGIHVTAVERDGPDIMVRGLRDPLAASIDEVAASLDIPAARVSADMQPFQSLQPEIIAARAAELFSKPDTIQFSVVETTLVVNGTAPSAWKDQLLAGFKTLAGVNAIDLSGLTEDVIAAPMSVPMPDARQLLMDRLGVLNRRRFFFDRGVQFVAGDEDALSQYVVQVQELQVDAEKADFLVSATLTGSTDGIGDTARNAVVAERRAVAALERLAAAGVTARLSAVPAGSDLPGDRLEDFSMRYVQVDLELQELPNSQ